MCRTSGTSTSKRRIAVVAIACSLFCGRWLPGQISGNVVDEQKKAVPNVWTVWTRFPDLTIIGDPVTSGAALSDAKGAFTFSGLKDGTYVLCAYPGVRSEYLSTCTWKPNPPQIQVKGTARVAAQEIVLEKGARINIRLDDEQGVWPDPTATKAGFQLGIRGESGLLRHAAPLQKDATGYDYVVLLPKGKRQRLVIEAEGVEVEEPSTARKGSALEEDLGDSAELTPRSRRFVLRKGK